MLISGCHSGVNPSPGLGVAQSLREAYPHARLIAKDHSVLSSGVHCDVFDDVWICRQWNELHLNQHRRDLESRLARGAWFISGLDVEAHWLSRFSLSRALVPCRKFLRETVKPGFEAMKGTSVNMAETIDARAPHDEIYHFCQRHGWRVWIKGPVYESKAVCNWGELGRATETLRQSWGSNGLFLQAHIPGREVSVALAAYRGRILDAVFMRKSVVTNEGKTWGGEVSDVPETLLVELAGVFRSLEWTGGCELEFIQDTSDALWLIDWNPRFPAWVFGATLAGRNLPAALIAAAAGIDSFHQSTACRQFIRVVREVPVLTRLPLPPHPPPPQQRFAVSKHPSGMPLLMRKGVSITRAHVRPARPASQQLAEVAAEAARVGSTPHRLFLAGVADRRFSAAAAHAKDLSTESCRVNVAYSVKTNPDPRLLRRIVDFGMYAEVISAAETQRAMGVGLQPARIVYNGPVPFHLELPGLQVAAVFADSLPALAANAAKVPSQWIGVRLRPPRVQSRFGVPLEDPEQFQRLTALVGSLHPKVRLALSMHVQSSHVGISRWNAIASSFIRFGAAIQQTSGRRVECMNFGGGWAPSQDHQLWHEVLPGVVREVSRDLPTVNHVFLEPGRSLVEPTAILLTKVLEVRLIAGRREAIIDASISDCPTAEETPHPVAIVRGARLEVLEKGGDVVLGRTCMEQDVLAVDVAFPRDLAEGAMLAICDVGAYDASMSYSFGRGGT